MSQNDEDMMAMKTFFNDVIPNIVAEEGRERNSRSVRMDVWRAFFARLLNGLLARVLA
jgi:hypothetical protein